MKLTVLGKYGPYPIGIGTATSGYMLDNNGEITVMDMGSGTLAKLLSAVDIKKVENIFISHLHFDHTSDLLPFKYLVQMNNLKINIYVAKEESDYYRVLFGGNCFNVINIDEDSVIQTKQGIYSFCKMVHPGQSYGIKVEGEKTFVYTGDTVYFEGLKDFTANADYVLCDSAKPDNFNGPHMKLCEALTIIQKPQSKLMVTHFDDKYKPQNDDKFNKNDRIIFVEEDKTYLL